MNVLDWVPDTRSLRWGLLSKLVIEGYSQKNKKEGDRIGPWKKPREEAETRVADFTGAFGIGIVSQSCSRLEARGPASVPLCPSVTGCGLPWEGIPSWGGDSPLPDGRERGVCDLLAASIW